MSMTTSQKVIIGGTLVAIAIVLGIAIWPKPVPTGVEASISEGSLGVTVE